jgi:hypothetical protein
MMQPISVLATIIAFGITALITAGYFFVRTLTSQLEASARLLNEALDQHRNSVRDSLAEHAEVGKKLLSAIDGLPTVANVAKLTKHPMTGAVRTEHSHIVTFKQE